MLWLWWTGGGGDVWWRCAVAVSVAVVKMKLKVVTVLQLVLEKADVRFDVGITPIRIGLFD
jgi:hypothetical protein